MIGSGRARTGRPRQGSPREGRSKKLCIRVREGDLRMLEAVAKYYDISKTDFIISAILSEFRAIKNDEN